MGKFDFIFLESPIPSLESADENPRFFIILNLKKLKVTEIGDLNYKAEELQEGRIGLKQDQKVKIALIDRAYLTVELSPLMLWTLKMKLKDLHNLFNSFN